MYSTVTSIRPVTAAVIALLLSTAVWGQTMYKCQDGGKTVYSDKPCTAGVEVKRLGPNGGPTPEEMSKNRMRAVEERQREIDRQRAKAAGRGQADAEQHAKAASGTATAAAKEPAAK